MGCCAGEKGRDGVRRKGLVVDDPVQASAYRPTTEWQRREGTHRFCRGKDVKPEVISPVIFAFLMSARVVRFPSELSSVNGRVLMAVDSRCRLVSALNELNDVGRSPAVFG